LAQTPFHFFTGNANQTISSSVKHAVIGTKLHIFYNIHSTYTRPRHHKRLLYDTVGGYHKVMYFCLPFSRFSPSDSL